VTRGLCSLALAALAGCGPTVAWYGRTPDRRHALSLVEADGVQHLVVDGRRGRGYQAIALGSLALSPAGRVAYGASNGGWWVVVVDGRATGRWEGVADVRFSPDGGRLAHVAELGKRWSVVVVDEGSPGPWLDAVLDKSLTFSADGQHVAWAGLVRGKSVVVVDGEPGPAWDGVGALAFAGDRPVYSARRGQDVFLVDGGATGRAWRRVVSVVTHGARVAYAAQDRGGTWFVIADGVAFAAAERPRAITFSRDGKRLAWIDGARAVVDGAVVASALAIGSVSFRDDGEPIYSERIAGGWRVVAAGQAGPTFDAITTPVSAEARWGYAGRLGREWSAVVDGRVMERARWVSSPVFAPGGARVAWLAARGPGAAVVIDGRPYDFDLVDASSLTFSRDGRHWGCVAGSRRDKRWFVVIDGRRTTGVDIGELAAEAVRGAPVQLSSWVAVALEGP
jgi:hypothetical protein